MEKLWIRRINEPRKLRPKLRAKGVPQNASFVKSSPEKRRPTEFMKMDSRWAFWISILLPRAIV
jgi:hypothetical protein